MDRIALGVRRAACEPVRGVDPRGQCIRPCRSDSRADVEEHRLHRPPWGRVGGPTVSLDERGRGGRSRPRRSGGNPCCAPAYAPHPGGGPPEESPPPDLRGGPRASRVLLHGSPECDWPSERRRGVPSEGPGKTRTHPFGKGSPPPLVLPERRRVSVARPALEPASEIGSREGGDGSRHRHSGTRSELGSSPRRGRIQRQGDGSGGTSPHGADRSESPLLPIGAERHGIIGLARETSLGGSRNLSGGGRSTDEAEWLSYALSRSDYSLKPRSPPMPSEGRRTHSLSRT